METKYLVRRAIFGLPLAWLAYKLIYFFWLATAVALGEINI